MAILKGLRHGDCLRFGVKNVLNLNKIPFLVHEMPLRNQQNESERSSDRENRP